MANNITLSYPSAFYHQFLDKNGKPLTGGKLYTYSAGTSTSIPTYKTIGDTSSANTNTNPIILDNAGVAHIVIETDKAYKFVLFDKNDAKIDEWDNVTGNIGGGGGSSEDIVVVGTPNEIDVLGSVTQGVKRYVVSLSNSVKITILQLIGLYNNVLNSLGNKADNVQGATAGNLAALDASGNLTDSGSKAADFKTKQTPVADPIASGNGLEFIDSVSQNENGEVVLHKNTVQSASTTYKGVVQLNNAIDSTSTTEAATPKAVKDAYDELNNKIVARAVFLSQAEWAVQSQLQGDPAKVYYVENGTGEDAYTVYVWKESTSTYEEVDESSIDLDGYWHDGPTTTGSGNVVTNITLGNDGVPQVEKGMSAEPAFSVLPIEKGGTGKSNRKAATYNLFSDMRNIESDPDESSKIVFRYGAPTEDSGMFFTRPIGRLWNYIRGKILGWYDWTRVDSGTGRYAKICSIADPASGTSYTVDVLVTHMTSYYAVTSLVRITVSHGSSSVQASILASDSLFYAVDSGNPPKVYTYVDGNGKRTFVFDTASAYQTAQGFVFRAVGGFSDKWSFFGDVGCSNDSADLGSIGTKQDALDVTFVFASYAKTAGHAETAANYASGGGIDTALAGKLDKTGDASNTTATFTKASGDTSSMTSGSKLSVLFTAISSFFASLKALAFKDKVSDSDISGTISNSHIASASTWNGKQDSLGISASGDTGKFLNERGVFATPNYPSVPSVINNLTSDSTTDALSAAQGKALNTGKADNYLKCFRIQNAGSGYAKIGRINVLKDSIWGDEMGCTFAIQCMYNSVSKNYRSVIGLMNIQFAAGSDRNIVAKMIVTQSQQTLSSITQSLEFIVSKVDNSKFDLFVRFLVSTATKALNINLIDGYVGISYEDSLVLTNTAPSPAVNVPFVLMTFVESDGKGSPTTPVYVDSNGQVQSCDTSQMGVCAASYAEAVNLAKNSDSTNGDYIYVGSGTGQRIGNAGNAKTWDGHAISIGSVSSSAGTISIV